MLRTASTLLRLRHLRTPWPGGVRRLCSSEYESSIPNPDDYFHSETEARELFETWCKKYSKTYPSEEEKLFRFGRFRGTLERCTCHNQKRDNPEDYCFETYETADETLEEYAWRAGGWLPRLPRGPPL